MGCEKWSNIRLRNFFPTRSSFGSHLNARLSSGNLCQNFQERKKKKKKNPMALCKTHFVKVCSVRNIVSCFVLGFFFLSPRPEAPSSPVIFFLFFYLRPFLSVCLEKWIQQQNCATDNSPSTVWHSVWCRDRNDCVPNVARPLCGSNSRG